MSPVPRISRFGYVFALALAMLFLASPAHASTASVSGNLVTYTDGTGSETNNVTISRGSGGAAKDITLAESGGPTITAGAGCTPSGGTSTVCSVQNANSATVTLDLQGGDDQAQWLGASANFSPTTFLGGAGTDSYTGSTTATNDTLDGGTGDDTLSGGAGIDTVTYSSRTTPVVASIGTASGNGETALSESDNINSDVENLTGGSAGDVLTGSDGVINTLTGNGGDDSLDGGTGNDIFAGGTTNETTGDTVTYAGRNTAVTATVGGTGGVGGESDNIGSDIENLIGGSAGDTLTGSSAVNRLTGNGGNDTLDGGVGADILNGGDNDDTLKGGVDTANDTLNGDLGSDTADYSARSTGVTATVGGTGGQTSTAEADVLNVENLRGGTAADILTGDAGANTLDGFSGNNDSLTGGNVNAGADPDGADTFIGGAGTGDTVNYTLRTGGVDVTLDGTANDGDIATSENDNVGSDGTVENVNGGGGNDTLRGQATSVVNVLTGNGGDDTLDGGVGDDTLNGNAGNDTYDAKAAAGAATSSTAAPTSTPRTTRPAPPR